MTTLRYRCAELLDKLNSLLQVNQSVAAIDAILEFVVAERGKAAAPELDETLPVVAYFKTDEDRDGFIVAVHEAKPNMTVKKV